MPGQPSEERETTPKADVIGQTALGSNLLIGGAGLLFDVLKGNTAFLGKD
jgi:hypothetical protein